MTTDYFDKDIADAFERLCRTEDTESVDSAVRDLRAMADAGDMTASAVVGRAMGLPYINGHDDALCRQYLEKSADSGNPLGQYYLGELLFFGYGPLPEDRVYGRWLLEQSASQGCQEAAEALRDKEKDVSAGDLGKMLFRTWLRGIFVEPLISILDRIRRK